MQFRVVYLHKRRTRDNAFERLFLAIFIFYWAENHNCSLQADYNIQFCTKPEISTSEVKIVEFELNFSASNIGEKIPIIPKLPKPKITIVSIFVVPENHLDDKWINVWLQIAFS